MKTASDASQSMQRIKVGILGLAAVILLIGLASAVLRTATRETPVHAAGSAQADVVANLAADDAQRPVGGPLAELGVTTVATNAAAPGDGR